MKNLWDDYVDDIIDFSMNISLGIIYIAFIFFIFCGIICFYKLMQIDSKSVCQNYVNNDLMCGRK